MSGFVCPHCSECTDIFGTGGGKSMAEEFKVKFLGAVPMDAQFITLVEEGRRPHYPVGTQVNGQDISREESSGDDTGSLMEKYKDCSLYHIFKGIAEGLAEGATSSNMAHGERVVALLRHDTERTATLLEIAQLLPITVAKLADAIEMGKMPLVDTLMEVSEFQGPDLCDTCATYASELDHLALVALMRGDAESLLDAHMRCRGRLDRWDADFSGRIHESMLKLSPMKSLARRQALAIVEKHGSSVQEIQKLAPIGKLYGPRGTEGVWAGNANGWKCGTDLSSHLDKQGRDKLDALAEVFFHEYGAARGYAAPITGQSANWEKFGKAIAKWIEQKNEFDARASQAPFTVVGFGGFCLCDKLFDTPNHFNWRRDGCEDGGVMSYIGPKWAAGGLQQA
ncbi:hypothetical protein NLG97_g10880 [Lecanicillium saksenae]|uniref:Uncharacterized protein n=1 Tax=Lecanicillium saksenae TaxID=468837 RepID=A0ACC1QEX4_9HYPO|nr:hypothetical protein NLG97_g10880 [Lecanicillium saksenae]